MYNFLQCKVPPLQMDISNVSVPKIFFFSFMFDRRIITFGEYLSNDRNDDFATSDGLDDRDVHDVVNFILFLFHRRYLQIKSAGF